MPPLNSEKLAVSVVFYIGTFRNQRICVSQWTACVVVLT